MNEIAERKLMTGKELAEVLGVSKDTINATVERLDVDGVRKAAICFLNIRQLLSNRRFRNIITLLTDRLIMFQQPQKKIR